MEFTQAIQANLLSPAVLFLALGVFAAVSKSDLKFPESLDTTLTLDLLTTIGFKGGVAIHEAGLGAVWLPALAAVALGGLIPLWTCPVLQKLGGFNLVVGGRFSLAAPGARHARRDAVLGRRVLLLIGVLALVLLEMGMLAGRRLGDLKKLGAFLLAHGRARHHVSLQHHCRSAAFL